jgi:hypothetical protein
LVIVLIDRKYLLPAWSSKRIPRPDFLLFLLPQESHSSLRYQQ